MELGLTTSLGLFVLSASVVVLAAITMTKGADVVASQTKLGRLWVGSLLVAGATSLPELVANVTAVRIGAPALAVGNIFGANMLNMSNLVLVVALWGGRDLFQRILPQHVAVALFAGGLTIVATLFVVVAPQIKWLFVSPASVVILGGYVVGTRVLARFSSEGAEPEATEESSHSLRWGWVVFLLSAGVIFIAAPLLAITADRIADLTGIGQDFIGVVAVAFVTTLPELTAAITGIRIGAPDLAIAGIYGTNAFNIAVLGVADLFHAEGSMFASPDIGPGMVVAGTFAIILMGLGTLQLRLRRPVRHFSLTEPSTIPIVAIYMVGLYVVFRLT